MGLIKLIMFFLYVIVIGGLSPVFWLILSIRAGKDAAKKDRLYQNFVKGVFHLVNATMGVKVSVKGLENIPTDEAVLYIGNHRSYFDILVSYIFFPNPAGFMAKKEMDRYPVLRTWMRRIHCLFLDRDNPKEGLKTILEAIENIKNGYSVVIFPEGTRAKTEEMLPFHEGSFKVATKTNCKIVPMAISNTSAAFEDHMPWFRSAKVNVEFGKPIILSELEPEQKKFLGEYTQGVIRGMLEAK